MSSNKENNGEIIKDIELEMKSNHNTNSDFISIGEISKKEIAIENGSSDPYTEVTLNKKENNIEENNKIENNNNLSLDLDFALNIESMLFQNYFEPNKYANNKIIYIENDFQDIITININKYIIHKINGEIDIYNNNVKIKKIDDIIKSICFNEELSLLIIINENKIIGLDASNFKEKINIDMNQILLKNKEIKDNKNTIIFIDIINDLIILICKNIKNIIYFIQYNFESNIINLIYYDELENDLENNKYFGIYDKENGLYYLINKNKNIYKYFIILFSK